MNNLASYRIVSVCASVVCVCLSLALLLVPNLIYWIFGIQGNEATDVMSKRAAILFVGLSLIAFNSRTEPVSSLRQTLTLAFSVVMLGLAALGVVEFIRQTVGFGIWLAIVVELTFALAYFQIWRKGW